VNGWGQGRQPPEAVARSASLEASRSRVYFKKKYSCSPENGSFASVVTQGVNPEQLDASTAASGPHDFAVRIMRARLLRITRPPHLTARS
jgi:hypothetical protein